MGWEILRTGKLSDRQILSLFDELRAELGYQRFSLYVGGMPVPPEDAALEAVRANDDAAISRAEMSSDDKAIQVSFRRGEGGDANSMDSGRSASPYFDDIGIRAREASEGGAPALDAMLRCIAIVKNHVRFDRQPAVDRLGRSATSLLQAQFSQLSDLFVDRTKAIEERSAQIEQLYAQKVSDLEASRLEMEANLAAKEAAATERLRVREEELEARGKVLDDRDHMHVRRDLRSKITSAVQTRLSESLVPRTAGYMRWGVFGISLTASAVFALFAWEGITSYNGAIEAIARSDVPRSPDVSTWLILIRGAISSVVALGFIVFAITWLRRIYQEDVQMHRDLERFAYDIDRASWAIETIMEASNVADNAGLPSAWIEGVTRNLFESQRHRQDDATSDALATLLSASARAEVGPGGAKFELNGNGAKKLAKEISQ